MDRLTEYILDNRDIKAFISDAAGGRLSHAYLISAEDNETVSAALKTAAKACLCLKHGCNACNTCLRIDSGNHSNVRYYSEYSVDVVKSIISATYMETTEEGAAVFLLDSFNGVSLSAQNKLLKTLEEPSQNVIIIIGTTNDAAILKTVMSRVKKITLRLWNSERIRNELISEGADISDAELASALCPDSLANAREIIKNESVKAAYQELRKMVVELERSNEIPRFLTTFGDNNAEITERLSLLESIFSLALRDAAKGVDTDINARFNIAALSNILEAVADAKAKAKVNVNAQNIASALLMNILEIRYRTAK